MCCFKTIKILMLYADQCREDNFCSFWSYEENINTKEKKCSLLSTCEKTTVDPSPILTFSGAKECYPEQEKRRKCQPGCPDRRKFCHGRCVPAGIGQWRCLFGTCSASPFRTSTESCFELAFQEEEENCHQACSWTGQEACQECISQHLPDQCNELSGAPCWHCSLRVYEKLASCKVSKPKGIEVVECVRSKQQAGCESCVCTLICYWEAGSAECKACLGDDQAAELWLDNQR